MTVERRRDNPPKDFSVFGERASLTLGLITALTGIVMSITAAWLLLNHSQEFQVAERLLSQQSDTSQIEPEPKTSFKEKRIEEPVSPEQKLNLKSAVRGDAAVETIDQKPPDQQPKLDYREAQRPASEGENARWLAADKSSQIARSTANDGDRAANHGSKMTADVIQRAKETEAPAGETASLQLSPIEESQVSRVADEGNATDQPAAGEVMSACAPLFSAIFTSNKASPIAENLAAKVKALALWLNDNPHATVIVEGHTDVWGEASYNLALSERRADSVVRLLVAAGAPSDDRLLAQGLGEEVAMRRGGAGSDKDRRVSMRVEGGTPCNQAFANGELDG